LSLAVSTGARRSQITALRLGEVDLENGQIGFIQALLDAKSGPVLRPTKTKRTYRVDLDATCLEILTAHIARARARAEAAGVELDRSSFVFSDDPAGVAPWKPNWVTKQFIKYRTVVKVDWRLHDLRHFTATTMLTAGVPITTVSARLSHARTSTTLNVTLSPAAMRSLQRSSAAFSDKRATRRRPHAFGAPSITDLPDGGTSASIEVVDAPHLFQVKVA
jgi:integrase